MSTVRTQRRLDPAHLASILGAPVSTAGGAVESTAAKDVSSDVPEATLQAAIDAYVYNPDWDDPDLGRLRELVGKQSLSADDIAEALRLIIKRLG